MTDEQLTDLATLHLAGADDGDTLDLLPLLRAVQAAERKFALEVVEQRLHTWRQRLMNKNGDRLALDNFMGQESIDDLIDYVCDEWA